MFYVYCLQDKISKELYYGYTNDLVRRFSEHKTKNINFILIYYEAYRSESDARKRERKLKDYGQSRSHLKRRLDDSLFG